MTWSSDKPTVPGWYWYKDRQSEPTIFRVVDTDRGLSVEQNGYGEPIPVAIYHNSHWAGPLELPSDSKDYGIYSPDIERDISENYTS